MSQTLQGLANKVLQDVTVEHEVGLCMDDYEMRVRTNSVPLKERLLDYFRANVADVGPNALDILAVQAPEPDFGLEFTDWRRDPGKVGRKEAYCDVDGGRVIHKVRTGMQFLIGPELRIGVGDCQENDNQIINFVIAQLIRHHLAQGALLCHSAGITHNGPGLTIAATSGAGKSTLALHLMSAGVSFVSNDRVLVTKEADGHVMHGVPKQPRVNPGTLLNNPDLGRILEPRRVEELKKMPLDELWELEEKYDVDIDKVYGTGRWDLSCPLLAFVVLNWSRKNSGPPQFQRVELAERPDLLELIMKGPGPFHMSDDGDFLSGKEDLDPEPYLQGFTGVPVFEVSGGVDFDAGVQWCLKLLETGV